MTYGSYTCESWLLNCSSHQASAGSVLPVIGKYWPRVRPIPKLMLIIARLLWYTYQPVWLPPAVPWQVEQEQASFFFLLPEKWTHIRHSISQKFVWVKDSHVPKVIIIANYQYLYQHYKSKGHFQDRILNFITTTVTLHFLLSYAPARVNADLKMTPWTLPTYIFG